VVPYVIAPAIFRIVPGEAPRARLLSYPAIQSSTCPFDHLQQLFIGLVDEREQLRPGAGLFPRCGLGLEASRDYGSPRNACRRRAHGMSAGCAVIAICRTRRCFRNETDAMPRETIFDRMALRVCPVRRLHQERTFNAFEANPDRGRVGEITLAGPFTGLLWVPRQRAHRLALLQ
jgi:hypothetical protein